MATLEEVQRMATGLVSNSDAEGLKNLLIDVMADDGNKPIARAGMLAVSNILDHEVNAFCAENGQPKLSQEHLQMLPVFVIDLIRNCPLKANFDESDFVCRRAIFNYNGECGAWSDGASVYCALNFDSTVRPYTPDEKAEVLVSCAEAFLQDENNDSAMTMCSKAGQTIGAVGNNTKLLLRYRVIRAKVDDASRKFVEAARQYHELSNTVLLNIPVEEKLTLLANAVTCAVLGSAGPQRSRILGLLDKDDRLKDLVTLPGYQSHASVLHKMYTERLLLSEELETFEGTLAAHQKAITGQGWTIVEKAVIEHNMLAASRVYDNITFTQLGSLLRLDMHQAERVAAKMISEGRLNGNIDQTGSLLNFDSEKPLQGWDERIRDVCNLVSDTFEQIVSRQPELAA